MSVFYVVAEPFVSQKLDEGISGYFHWTRVCDHHVMFKDGKTMQTPAYTKQPCWRSSALDAHFMLTQLDVQLEWLNRGHCKLNF